MKDDSKFIDYEFENQEWIDSLEYILKTDGTERARELLQLLQQYAQSKGASAKQPFQTAYANTISSVDEVPFPGNIEIELKIENMIRWNAMAMVVKANKASDAIGGHISSYASSASLFEVGFQHFFKAPSKSSAGDMVYFQGHTTPGMYARSFLEGRLSEQHLLNFRREMAEGGGLSSYPHPQLMPEYWQFPTVSMGLGAIGAIYQARFCKYLLNHGLIQDVNQRVWSFCGDGEMDEPESIGALSLAAREQLDNLTMVINCNLQRLDGPVRGNGSVVQEFESLFIGAGWNVIKVLWSSAWDRLFAKDTSGILLKTLGGLVDGERQKLSISDGVYIRKHLFGRSPELEELVKDMSDEALEALLPGGHDITKIYNAYHAAVNHKDQPTVILAQTIKGFGMGDAGEARNVAHGQKKMSIDHIKIFRDRFHIDVPDDVIDSIPFVKPDDSSIEIQYLKSQREKLGGYVPQRNVQDELLKSIDYKPFVDFYYGSAGKPVSTTMIIVKFLTTMLRTPQLKDLLVPIVPDESRTFGMEALFREVGIYSSVGQLYDPVDRESLLYYKEAKDGAILEEGITEAGAMSSFIAAGSAYANHGVNTIPFYIFYSMFGFQRIGDFAWAAADTRCKGFMIGATAGKTSLPGEGLQHQDGTSHVIALSIPTLRAYDPAFAYEIAAIMEDGLQKMYVEGQEIFYYLTVTNDKYEMPEIPEGVKDGIIDGMYLFDEAKNNKHNINLYGSGAIMGEVIKARDLLKEIHQIDANVWSITSYKALYDNANSIEQRRLFEGEDLKNTIENNMSDEEGLHVCVSDYMRALPLSVSKWFNGDFIALGTDGFGMSEDRASLRKHFQIDAQSIVQAVINKIQSNGIDQ